MKHLEKLLSTKVTLFILFAFSLFSCESDSLDITEIDNNSITSRSTKTTTRSDWSGLLEVIIVENSVSGYLNEVSATVPTDYVVVGGGAVISNSGANGALLTGSYPNSELYKWTASSKDHLRQQYHTLTAYAIGLRVKGLSRNDLRTQMILTSSQTTGGNDSGDIVSSLNLPSGYKIIGGGAQIIQKSGYGVMLKGSRQTGTIDYNNINLRGTDNTPFTPTNGWRAKAKDHLKKSSATLVVYAIGIKPNLPVVGELFIESLYKAENSAKYINKFSVSSNVDSRSVLTCGGGETFGTYYIGRFLYSLKPTPYSFNVISTDHRQKDDMALTGCLSISLRKK